MLAGPYVIQMECVWRNGKPLKGAAELFDAFKENDISFILTSEQSGSGRRDIASKMQNAGLKVHAENILTGALAACSYIHWRWPDKDKIYSVGGKGIREAMDMCHLTEERRHPDFVIMGMDRELTYADYNDILHVLYHGARLVSVDERLVMYNEGEADLGNGALVNMMEIAAGTRALAFGRGTRRMLQAGAALLHTSYDQLCVAGNDFRKDLQTAVKEGCTTFLVSEGRGITHQGISEQDHPDYIVDSVDGIAK